MIWIRKDERKLYCFGLRNPLTYEEGEYRIFIYKRESTRRKMLSKLHSLYETIEFEIDLNNLIEAAINDARSRQGNPSRERS